MMKILKGLLSVVVIFALASCSPPSDSSDEHIDPTHKAQQVQTEEPPALIVGVDGNYPPIVFHNESGELVGSDIDLAREFARRINRKIVFKEIDWVKKDIELSTGKIDMIWNGLSVIPERANYILFSAPYQRVQVVVVVPNDSPVKELHDLKGKIVAVQEGSHADIFLEKSLYWSKFFQEVKRYRDVTTVFSSNQAIMRDITKGILDGGIMDETLADYYMKQEQGKYRTLKDSELIIGKDAVGVKLGNKELKKEIDRVLADMYKDGTTKNIMEKWIGKDISMPIVAEF